MSNKEFSEKLKTGIELAGKRMLEEKALRGEDVIVSADGKTIERIPATQLLGIMHRGDPDAVAVVF